MLARRALAFLLAGILPASLVAAGRAEGPEKGIEGTVELEILIDVKGRLAQALRHPGTVWCDNRL